MCRSCGASDDCGWNADADYSADDDPMGDDDFDYDDFVAREFPDHATTDSHSPGAGIWWRLVILALVLTLAFGLLR